MIEYLGRFGSRHCIVVRSRWGKPMLRYVSDERFAAITVNGEAK